MQHIETIVCDVDKNHQESNMCGRFGAKLLIMWKKFTDRQTDIEKYVAYSTSSLCPFREFLFRVM